MSTFFAWLNFKSTKETTMTLKDLWLQLGKPKTAVYRHRDTNYLVNLQTGYLPRSTPTIPQSLIFTSTDWSLPSLTLAECHEWAKKVQGGDGFPFSVWCHSTGKVNLCHDRFSLDFVYNFFPSERFTYLKPQGANERTFEYDMPEFSEEYLEQFEEENSEPNINPGADPKECTCPSEDLLKGHGPGCPFYKEPR